MGGWSSSAGDAITGVPVVVGEGGTGATSLTDGGVLLGSGTGAVTAMGVLADGTILIGDGTTDPTTLAAFSSSTGTLNVASGGTGAATLTDGGVLLGSGTGAITPMAVLANGAIIVGDGATDPVALQAFTSSTGDLTLAAGGTEASLTAVNGAIVYCGASAMALSAAGASGQLLSSAGAASPVWTTSTYPATNAINTVLYASAANTMAALATTNDGILITDSAGAPTIDATPDAAGWFHNLAIVNATTTNANDSIKITSASGTALSATNSGWIDLPSATTGQVVRFSVSADVTINLTGAHWENGTRGDLTDALLRVLALNDNGTLRWGVALLGGRETLLTTDTNATATNINLAEEVLCTAAVASASNTCKEFGHFRANFDDTGGAAEDLWAVQTGVGDIMTGGSADGLWQTWNTVQTGGTAPVTNITRWCQQAQTIMVQLNIDNTSNAATWIATLPADNRMANASFGAGYTADNSAAVDQGFVFLSAGSASMDLRRSTSTNWTAANTKSIAANFLYEVGPAASFIP